MWRYSRLKRSIDTGGFTFLELLVVIVMVGIISAIAAPSWLSFLNRQRMNSARGELMNVLKNAQDEAQSRRQSVQVNFPDLANLAPGSSPLAVEVRPNSANTPGVETLLGNGEVGENFQVLADSPGQIVFDYDGRLVEQSGVTIPYVIKIVDSNNDSANPTQSCVAITTLLGGLQPANNEQCDNF